jgi:hypothetical protein
MQECDSFVFAMCNVCIYSLDNVVIVYFRGLSDHGEVTCDEPARRAGHPVVLCGRNVVIEHGLHQIIFTCQKMLCSMIDLIELGIERCRCLTLFRAANTLPLHEADWRMR